MAVRNSKEFGENLFKIANLLTTNSRLLRLLKYTDDNPLDKELHEDVAPATALHNNVKIVPLVNESEETTESTVVVVFEEGGVMDNEEFKAIRFSIMVYTPLSKWILNDINLRPFLIMSEVEKSLKQKRVESVGTIKYHGFTLHTITDLMSCYRMEFSIDVYN